MFTVIVIGSGSFGSGNCKISNESDDELSTCFFLLLQHMQMMIPIMINKSIVPAMDIASFQLMLSLCSITTTYVGSNVI